MVWGGGSIRGRGGVPEHLLVQQTCSCAKTKPAGLSSLTGLRRLQVRQ